MTPLDSLKMGKRTKMSQRSILFRKMRMLKCTLMKIF